jgi:hypothetical protein
MFGEAFAEGAARARACACREAGTVFISVKDNADEARGGGGRAVQLHELGFRLVATRGHRGGDRRCTGMPVACRSDKVTRRAGRTSLDMLMNGEDFSLVDEHGRGAAQRRSPTRGRSGPRRSPSRVTCFTTIAGALAAVVPACDHLRAPSLTTLQGLHRSLKAAQLRSHRAQAAAARGAPFSERPM